MEKELLNKIKLLEEENERLKIELQETKEYLKKYGVEYVPQPQVDIYKYNYNDNVKFFTEIEDIPMPVSER
jgi:hypothetical protein